MQITHKLDRALVKYLPPIIYKRLMLFYRRIKSFKLFRKGRHLLFRYKLKRTTNAHKKRVKELALQSKITVVFFVINCSVWKNESLYRLMEADKKFEPVIVVCPNIVLPREDMFIEMNKTLRHFKRSTYNVICTYNKENGKWLDVKRSIKPDIIFFTNPHYITKPAYFIYNFLDTLTCYVPYGIMTPNRQKDQFDKDFHNFLWRGYYETYVHKQMAEKYSRNGGKNIIVTGYPIFDEFKEKIDNGIIDVWKIKDRRIKRIIWAPHHTINLFREQQSFASFIKFHEFMFELAEKYKDKIQIAFKPHPVLRSKLSKSGVWGKAKTDQYYSRWRSLNNGQLEEGGYTDLFMSSDAMVLDSISFMVEYLYTSKPLLFTVNDDSVKHQFNEFGQLAFKNLYKGYNKEDIEKFITDIVFSGIDYMKDEREKFLEKYFSHQENKSASQIIFDNIKTSIS